MTDDLVAFLRARLDDDEQTARMASKGPWTQPVGFGHISGGPEGRVPVAQQAQAWNANHITRHDPARVLAEVDAKRRIVDEYERADAAAEYPDSAGGYASGLDYAVQLLALPYASHPDYRSEWAPDA